MAIATLPRIAADLKVAGWLSFGQDVQAPAPKLVARAGLVATQAMGLAAMGRGQILKLHGSALSATSWASCDHKR